MNTIKKTYLLVIVRRKQYDLPLSVYDHIFHNYEDKPASFTFSHDSLPQQDPIQYSLYCIGYTLLHNLKFFINRSRNKMISNYNILSNVTLAMYSPSKQIKHMVKMY